MLTVSCNPQIVDRPASQPSPKDTQRMVLRLLIAIGESDCENIGGGFLAQPVNAVSSLAFLVFGIIALFSMSSRATAERSNRLVFGALMIATGIGSVLFHGPQGQASKYLHDVTFVVTLLAIATMNLAGILGWSQRRTWTNLGGVSAVVATLLLVWPSSTNAIAGLTFLSLVGVDVALRRSGTIHRRWWFTAVVAMVVAGLFFASGRTGGPLCDSSSLFQGHALWHVLSATALWAYFQSTTPVRIDTET